MLGPFVASSFPILLKKGGQVSSPMLRNLTPADVLLVVLAVAAVAGWILGRRVAFRAKLLTFIALGFVAGPLCYFAVKPPPLAVYSQYREDVADGLAEWSVTTVIPYSPRDRLRDRPAAETISRPPSATHWMGTTPTGEDVLSGMVHASRVSLSIGFISTGIALLIGVVVGGVMGYFSGKTDILGMRVIEIFEAIPTLFLLIMFVTFYGRSLYAMMVILGLTGWTGNARFIRAEFLALRDRDFVQAARACGLPLRSILFRHMLPNGISPVLVSASFGVASAILFEAILSFLSLGVIDAPSWGKMLNSARGQGGDFNWWMAVFPGGAIFLTVFAYNLIGEAVRDALDPKLRKRE